MASLMARFGLMALRGIIVGFRISGVNQFRGDIVARAGDGPFKTIITYYESLPSRGDSGQEIDLSTLDLRLMDEEITLVKRSCCSLTGKFPSGILTLVTWTLVGQTFRHEFVIIHTQNHFILIEIQLDEIANGWTKIVVCRVKDEAEKKRCERLFARV